MVCDPNEIARAIVTTVVVDVLFGLAACFVITFVSKIAYEAWRSWRSREAS